MSEDSINDLPSVQVGDPFWEKLILEATMEIIETGAVVGMQDMGAAGITCSTSEMSAKTGVGMDVWLDKVPMRQADMKSWELLLSESQERMLVVVEKGKEKLLEAVFEKWDLTYAQIAMVTDTGRVRYFMGDVLEADIPAESLVLGGGAPVYHRTWKEPQYFKEIEKFNLSDIADVSLSEAKEVAMQLSSLPNIASKKWIYRQYDSMVGTINESTNLPSDAAVVKILDTEKSLALTVDCNSRYIYADPSRGTQIAVAEAARNIRCSGGVPTAITNCLNFGNPYNEEVYFQFKNAIEGMGIACRKFDTPVTGGNVSFYNQSTSGLAVYPTPTIGMVGIIESPNHRLSIPFQTKGAAIVLLGKPENDLGSSQYLAKLKNIEYSPCPSFDLDAEYRLHQVLGNLAGASVVESVHDISEGGLFVACLESAMSGNLGFDICTDKQYRLDSYLFGESQSRVVVSLAAEKVQALEAICSNHGVPMLRIGTVTAADSVIVNGENWGNVNTFAHGYSHSIGTALES
jgi:phosphoribosylformylglycinamidine synthase